MKYPPRFAYRIRPPFEAMLVPQPRQLLAGGLLLAGLVIAVFGAFHDVQSIARKSTVHAAVASPVPAGGSFQGLVDPKPSSAEPSLTPAEPDPTVVPQELAVVPMPPAPLYAAKQGNPTIPPQVQVWSAGAVLTPKEVMPNSSATSSGMLVSGVLPPVDMTAGVSAPATPAPQLPSTPTPSPQPSATPTSVPSSPTPTPRPSTIPTPTLQPSPTAGSPGCVPTRRHPCQPRGER